MSMELACVFQEDNHGQGSEIFEAYLADGTTFKDGDRSILHGYLNPANVERLKARGVVRVFLSYRGDLDLAQAYR